MKLWALLFFLLFSSSVTADIGSVTELTGSATAKRGKDVVVLTKGSKILQNDKVETKNGKVKIVFNDQTTVSVSEHSNLVIDEFVYDPNSKSNSRINIRAAQGTVRYASGVIAATNPKAVNITTPTAAIAVRGTDFIMAVNEIGASMVLLMPDCEDKMCSSGKIEVTSGATTTTLDQPYQVTLVETLGMPPTPPILVNLEGTGTADNLLVSPPKTASGVSAVAAARSAADKFNQKDTATQTQETQTAAKKENNKSEESEKTVVAETKDIEEELKENPYAKRIWRDDTRTQQLGWLYQSGTSDGKNFVRVTLPIDTTVTITVSQNSYSHSYQFAQVSSTSRINIVQNTR